MKLLIVVALIFVVSLAQAQMVSGPRIPGYSETFGLQTNQPGRSCAVQFVECSAPGNVVWPDEKPTFTIQIANTTGDALQTNGRIELIAYGTKGRPGNVWVPDMFKITDCGAVPFNLDLPARGFTNLTIAPNVPARFGAYALVADFGAGGRQFVTTFVRTFAAPEERVQYPKFCLDALPPAVLRRLGVHAIRYGVGYKPTTDKDFAEWFAREGEKLKEFHDAGVAVLFMAGGGAFFGDTQPLGRPRPWLDDNGVMQDTKFDLAWLPAYDADFQKFCNLFASTYGWPKGPINAFSLWNEPWEGISISGWGADMPRYREIYTAMAHGIEAARKDAGVEVLIGGCDSASNALDKLFGDGRDDFLKWFDFLSIHYQGLAPFATVKMWVDRKHPNGRVRIWDTESWVANTDDRVAAVIAANRSAGYDRAMGIFGGNIADERKQKVRTADGKQTQVKVPQAWSVAAAVGAATHFIGERDFKQLLFTNGLPWVIVFDGLKNPDDGTIVVVGDLGEEFGANHLLFRTARGLAEIAHKEELQRKLAAAPADEHAALEKVLRQPEVLSNAAMTIASGEKFSLYDFYGNPVPAQAGQIVVPLDGRGFFLRADGSPGSFAKLIAAVQSARIDGIEPLATIAHDLTARIEQHPTLRLTLINILNRPITGTLVVTLGKLTLDSPTQSLQFAPHETKIVTCKIATGTATPNNTYSLAVRFDAGHDGCVVHDEDLHVNVIAQRTITVDGKLDDWKDVLPQIITSDKNAAPSLTESAWFPFLKFDESATNGLATGYLAYDEKYFYFAAKIADNTPDDGMPRFATRNDDESFYPEKSYAIAREKTRVAPKAPGDTTTPRELIWPAGIRHYSYRKNPELPAGNSPNHDNVQIAFNVLPPDQKPWYPNPPGTMPGYVNYKDTDYEYALNPVAPKYGGGVEIWRLDAPGMPHKHFFPRQGKSPQDGPVTDGKLVIVRDGNTRIVEAALPWSEIPQVKQRLDAGQPIKFSFRVNDNAGAGCMELSRLRSVAKINNSFHVDWTEHWANELEFAFEK